MKIAFKVVLVVLVFLAVSSGITKIMLMDQDLVFFGAYGFSEAGLIAFGVTQLVGGILMVVPKVRMYGALIVAVTFVVSLALLLMDTNYPVAGITVFATVLLVWVAKSSKTPLQSNTQQ